MAEAQAGTLFDVERESLLGMAERISGLARTLIEETQKFRERLLNEVSTAPPVVATTEKKKSEVSIAIAHFDTKHHERFDTPAKFTQPKDNGLMFRLTKTYGLPKTISLIDQFFTLDDAWTVNAGFTVGIFSTKVAGLISSGAAPLRTTGATDKTRPNSRNAAVAADMIRNQQPRAAAR